MMGYQKPFLCNTISYSCTRPLLTPLSSFSIENGAQHLPLLLLHLGHLLLLASVAFIVIVVYLVPRSAAAEL